MKDFYTNSLCLECVFSDDNLQVAEWKAGQGLVRLEFKQRGDVFPFVFSLATQDWRKAKAFLSTNNIPLGPVKMKEGKCYFEVKDPDLNIIEIIETV